MLLKFHSFALALLLAASASMPARAQSPVTITHVHGLAYSTDGKQLMIPSHHGLAVFADGSWSKAAGPAHDYMGFSATRNSLYSSGHPAPGSGLTNPFGLIKSGDGGKTWRKLGLEGESDFHTLATSYETNAVYVVNHQPNSRMSQAGIYYTLGDGLKWQRAQARGLQGKLTGIAVHPKNAKIVAAGTEQGLFLSRDSAASFQPLVSGKQVLAMAFDLDGRLVRFSGHAGKATLAEVALYPGAKPDDIALPAMNEDAVAYIAQNPAQRDEIAVATFKRNVFVSKDRGRSWKQIAKEGSSAH